MTALRPDIMEVVGLVVRFQATPKETNVHAVKRIFRYLKGTLDLGLWYLHSDNFTLEAYTYENWEGNVDDRKSTSGVPFFLGKCLFS